MLSSLDLEGIKMCTGSIDDNFNVIAGKLKFIEAELWGVFLSAEGVEAIEAIKAEITKGLLNSDAIYSVISIEQKRLTEEA